MICDNEVEKWDIVEVELEIKYLSKFLLMVNQEYIPNVPSKNPMKKKSVIKARQIAKSIEAGCIRK